MEKKHKILIVDDNTDNLSILGNVLMRSNYALQLAKNGQMALQVAVKKIPDLILLDINMPGMSGYEVCKKLKADQLTKDIPVIFLTAHTSSENVIEGFSVGAVDYITKPFQEEELLLRVKTHLELKTVKEELIQKNMELGTINATKDKLFSIVAHDLRGSIGLMMNIMDIITNKADMDPERMHIYLKSQKELTHNTFFLLTNLLNWARQNMNKIVFHPENIQLNDLIAESISEIKFNAGQKNISVNLICTSTFIVFADVDMLKLIIRNLLANAIKFTPKNGNINVLVENYNDNVMVKITDSGIGMSDETIKKILSENEFYTTRGTNNETGSGLGLKLVKDFIAKNKGELMIESEINKGSSFSFKLPIN